jgi:hypothetical protein
VLVTIESCSTDWSILSLSSSPNVIFQYKKHKQKIFIILFYFLHEMKIQNSFS